MKMTSYIPIGSCKTCKAKVWSPTSWTGLRRDGTFNDTPKVPTCQCYKPERRRKGV